MFKAYGLLGILAIILVEANFILKIQPFANWYFPIVWIGYILVLDALIFKLKGKSLISNKPWQFAGLFILSAVFWWIFEIVNSLALNNWSYSVGGRPASLDDHRLYATIAFSTVLPAFLQTVELVRTIHLFDHSKLKRKHKITKRFLHTMMALGAICFFAPFLIPKLAFPLIWLSFFFFLDPINYLHKQPSIIGHLKDRKLVLPLSLLLAGIIMGLFWEFWNYWAIPKWTYDIPYVGFYKIFEMPILGYLGYLPFAFELYAMYWFVRSLFVGKKEHLLTE